MIATRRGKGARKGIRSIRINGSQLVLRHKYEAMLNKYDICLDDLTSEKLGRLDDHILAARHVNLLESVIPESYYAGEPFIGRLIKLVNSWNQAVRLCSDLCNGEQADKAEIKRLKDELATALAQKANLTFVAEAYRNMRDSGGDPR